MNDEFGLDGLNEEAEAAKKPADKKPSKKAAAPNPPPAERKMVRIIIDEVTGQKNYEVVGVNGKVYQIKRGVPVEVPEEVVKVLECATMTHIEQRVNKITGDVEDIERTFSAIPWRRA